MSGDKQVMPAPETLFPVKFIIGSRQILSVPKRLHKVHFSLEKLASGNIRELPPLAPELDGYRVLSAPENSLPMIQALERNFLIGGQQDYRRHYIDMSDGFEAYMNHFSAKTRSTLRRKQRKLEREAAQVDGGMIEIREFRTPEEIAEFMELAIPLSRQTYQARTLDAGLPEDEASRAEMMDLAAQDNLRCYLLYFRGLAISYLFLPIVDDTVIYAFLGYDSEYRRLSPGTVLQMEALARLFAEGRYRYFDFTEGDGPHKAMFGNRSIQARSFFLLRATPANRMLLGALGMFDGAVAAAKRLAAMTGAQSKIRQTIRRT